MDDPEVRKRMSDVPSPYGPGDTSGKILDIVEKLFEEGGLLSFEKEIKTKNL